MATKKNKKVIIDKEVWYEKHKNELINEFLEENELINEFLDGYADAFSDLIDSRYKKVMGLR